MTVLARAVRRARWLLLAGWIGAAVVCALALPTIDHARSGALGGLYPRHAAAIEAEVASKTQFGFPLLSRTIIVQRDPAGMSALDQAAAVRLAASLTRGAEPGFGDIAAALPVTNGLGSPPFVRERSTAAITYLFFRPSVGLDRRVELARQLVRRRVPEPPGSTTAVTGQAPALGRQSELIVERLPLIELATVLLVAVAVGLRFRAVGAPLVTLAAVGIAYLVSSRVLAYVGSRAGFAVPEEVEPIIVVLLFGVVTDYSIFYLSRFRGLLAQGRDRDEAVVEATAQLTPIVATAGLAVTAASLTLLVAHLEFIRVFGPGLAFAVLIGVLVALTFVPACLAVFGRAVYWPRRPALELSDDEAAEETATELTGRPRRSRALRFAARKPWTTIIACVLVLGAGAAGLSGLQLANPVIRGLPAGSEPRAAYEAAERAFAPGILAPTVVVVAQPGLTARRDALRRLQAQVARQPGVALVVGPAQQPLRGVRLGATLARSGDAVRLFVVLRQDPLGAGAIRDLRRLRDRMPGLLRAAGLPGAQASFAGDTALSAETIDGTVSDLRRVTPLALVAIFVIIGIFLRSLVAPLYLVATSVLGFAAALGITTLIFGELTYFVPFAAAVLLVALGSDYNAFLIGRIWQEAHRAPLAEAVPVAAARATKAITLAGVVLAASFALVALVPVRAFAELAVVMAIGLLLDALLVRTVLIPAVVLVVGRASGWPGHRFDDPPAVASRADPAT